MHPDEFEQPRAAVPGVHLPRSLGAAARWLAAALSLLIIVGAGVAWAMYQDFTNSVPRGLPVPAGGADADGSSQNILLVGNDTRAGATPAELRALHTGSNLQTVNADTMMVLHVPSN